MSREEIRRAPASSRHACHVPGIWRRFKLKIQENDEWHCPSCGRWWKWTFVSYEESWWQWELVPMRGEGK